MQFVELKLKQASAVLGVDPKDLQNLVQMKVLRPPRRKNFYWFDSRLLLEAKLALYLKASLGSSTELLARFTEALSRHLRIAGAANRRYLRLQSMPARGQEPVEIRLPLRQLAKELADQLPRAAVVKDQPRGRKRPEWNRELTRSLESAAGDLRGVTEPEIVAAIRTHRAAKRQLPEISVGGSRKRP
jgi:hypothetical protein